LRDYIISSWEKSGSFSSWRRLRGLPRRGEGREERKGKVVAARKSPRILSVIRRGGGKAFKRKGEKFAPSRLKATRENTLKRKIELRQKISLLLKEEEWEWVAFQFIF